VFIVKLQICVSVVPCEVGTNSISKVVLFAGISIVNATFDSKKILHLFIKYANCLTQFQWYYSTSLTFIYILAHLGNIGSSKVIYSASMSFEVAPFCHLDLKQIYS
jgi:hypothetical protein